MRHGDRTRLTRMRIRQLDIRAIPRVLRSAAVTTIPSGIGRTCRHTLPSMQTRTPLERNQMRGEHQPEHRISCQFPHRTQDCKGDSQCERPPDHSSIAFNPHYSPPPHESQYSKSLEIDDFDGTGQNRSHVAQDGAGCPRPILLKPLSPRRLVCNTSIWLISTRPDVSSQIEGSFAQGTQRGRESFSANDCVGPER